MEQHNKLKLTPSLIGISGKIGSGKDLTGLIIQYLTCQKALNEELTIENWLEYGQNSYKKAWEIKKMAGKLKDIACLLIGCTREQLEDKEYKEKELGEEWRVWFLINPTAQQHYFNEGRFDELDLNARYTGPYESEKALKKACYNQLKSNPNYEYISELLTPRKLLQLLGTECGREILHPNIWANSLFADYRLTMFKAYFNPRDLKPGMVYTDGLSTEEPKYPKWIITDIRFPNEAEAVKSRDGLMIRVNRGIINTYVSDLPDISTPMEHATRGKEIYEHPSETGLDDYKDFDYVIDNDSDIMSLVKKIKEILIKEKII